MERFIKYSSKEKLEQLRKYSDPEAVLSKAKSLGYDPNTIYLSPKQGKKYMIITPNGKQVNFGAIGYQDFTSHKDLARRDNYLKRSGGIRGNWENDKYSPNNLSRNLLW